MPSNQRCLHTFVPLYHPLRAFYYRSGVEVGKKSSCGKTKAGKVVSYEHFPHGAGRWTITHSSLAESSDPCLHCHHHLLNHRARVLCFLLAQRRSHGGRRGDVVWSAVCFKLLQSCLTLFDPMDHSLPGFTVHEIFQAIPEWVGISFFRGSSWPRGQTHTSYVSCTGRWVLQHHLISCMFSLRLGVE